MTFPLPAGGKGGAAERFVDGGDAAYFQQPRFLVFANAWQQLELRLDHLHVARGAGWFDFAEESDGLSGAEAALEICPVEPHALHGEVALAYGHLEDGRAAGAEQGGAANFGDDRGHFAGPELVEAARVLAVFVTEGQVIEEIFGDGDAFAGDHLGDLRANAANVHHRSVETGHNLDATTRWVEAANVARFGERVEGILWL